MCDKQIGNGCFSSGAGLQGGGGRACGSAIAARTAGAAETGIIFVVAELSL